MFRSFFLIILKFLKGFISHLIYLMQMILFVIGITARRTASATAAAAITAGTFTSSLPLNHICYNSHNYEAYYSCYYYSSHNNYLSFLNSFLLGLNSRNMKHATITQATISHAENLAPVNRRPNWYTHSETTYARIV